MHGTVTAFDDAAGYGEITGDDGRTWFLHCTQIADGTRTIAVGTPVTFDLRPWHLGRHEAVDVTRAP